MRAWVNLLYGESVGKALVLANQIKHISKYPLLVLIADDQPEEHWRALRYMGVVPIQVEPVLFPERMKGEITRYRYRLTMSKLRTWQLIDYEILSLIDNDLLFLRSADEIFDIANDIEFCAYFHKPWIFNSGVMVLRPSDYTFNGLMTLLANGQFSVRLPDQSLLINYWRGSDVVGHLWERHNTRRIEALNETTQIFHFADKKPWNREHRTELAPILPAWERVVGETKRTLEHAGFDAEKLLADLAPRPIRIALARQAEYERRILSGQ